MKKVLFLCAVLAVAVCLVAVAKDAQMAAQPGASMTIKAEGPAPILTSGGGSVIDMSSEELSLQLDAVVAEIVAAKASGQVPSQELYDRLTGIETLLHPRSPGDNLDQGSEDCSAPTEILATPYCDSGMLGNTDDCVGRPYNDVFYSFAVPMGMGGTYRFTTCGSVGDTYMRVTSGVCCTGTLVGTGDDQCGGADAWGEWILAEGTTYYIEVGLYTAGTGTAYNFNLSGPLPTTGIPVPANDLCTGAVALTLGVPVVGTTRGATSETFTPTTCGTSTSNTGSVWYSVVGNGHTLTVSTDNNCTTINTQIKVLTGTCGTFTCVAGQLDLSAYPGNSLNALSWCSDMDVTYYIVVISGSSTVSYNGPFTIVVNDGIPCSCDVMPLCGSPSETEPNDGPCVTGPRDPYVIACDALVYGLHCPESDSDYFDITVPPSAVMTLRLFDGDACSVNPTVNIRADLRDGTTCALIGSAGNTAGWIISNASGSDLFYRLNVYGVAGFRGGYKITTSCYMRGPCPDLMLNAPGSVSGSTVGVGDFCSLRAGQEQVVQVNIPYAGNWTFKVCETNYYFDTYIYLTSECCGGTTLAYDDDGCSPNSLQSIISCTPLSAGTYYLDVEPYSSTASGPFTVTVEACCSATPAVEFTREPLPQAACATVCTGSTTVIRVCQDGPFIPDLPPIVTVVPGCQTENCTETCDPGQFAYDPALWAINPTNGCWENVVGGLSDGCVCITLEDFLAVELQSFTAVAGNRSVTLNWTTRSEPNNDYFELWRDGEKIAEVDAQGSTSSGANYTWVDNGLTNGTTYNYTLMAVDINNDRSSLRTASATPEAPVVITEYALYQNYPNPFNPATSITFDLVEGGMVSLRVFNVVGQEVATLVNGTMANGRHTVTFNAIGLPSGLYIYRLDTHGFVSQQKMLLMK